MSSVFASGSLLSLSLLAAWAGLVGANALALPLDWPSARLFLSPPQLAGWTAGGFVEALARHSAALLRLLFLDLAVFGAGCAALPLLASQVRGGPRFHARWLAGLASLALTTFALGLSGLLRPPLLVAALAVAALAAAAQIRRGFRGPIPRFLPLPDPLTGTLLLLAAAAVLTSLLGALAPQTSYAAFTNYYLVPRRYLDAGRFFHLQFLPWAGYPHGFEHLFLLAFAVGDEVTARLLGWQEAALLLAALWGWSAREGVAGYARAAAVAAIATLPLTVHVAQFNFNDAAVGHAAVAGLWLLRAGFPGAACAAAGWLVALKYTGAVAAVPLLGFALAAVRGGRALALAAAAASVVPWLARNWLVHGSPLYPLFPSLLPTFESREGLDPAAGVTAAIALAARSWSLADWTALPWTAHLRPARAFPWDISSDTPGASALLALPVALLWPGAAVPRLALAAAFAIWVPLGGGVVRFFWPVMGWAAVLAAGAMSRAGLARAFAWTVGLLALLQVPQGWALSFLRVNPVAVALGAERPAGYLARIIGPAPHYMELAAASRGLFAGGRTLVLGDVKAWYWEGDFLLDVLTLRPRLARWIAEADSARCLLAKFRQAGVRHVVYRPEGMAAFLERTPESFAWTPRSLEVWGAFWLANAAFREERLAPEDRTFYYLFDVVPGAGRPWPRTLVPFTFPGTEALTAPGDGPWLDGRRAEAVRAWRGALRAHPGFPPLARRLAAAGAR